MKAGRRVAVFPSIHDVMRVDRELAAAGVAHDLVPVPRGISSECGMAIEVAQGEDAADERIRALGGAVWVWTGTAWREGGS